MNGGTLFFFALAVAVGPHPGNAAHGRFGLPSPRAPSPVAQEKVIVKRLNSIQNFGAMDVLCTDQDRHAHLDRVILEKYCDVFQRKRGRPCSTPISSAIFRPASRTCSTRHSRPRRKPTENCALTITARWMKSRSIFSRKMLSVVVETPEKEHQLITKGAPEARLQSLHPLRVRWRDISDGADPRRQPH